MQFHYHFAPAVGWMNDPNGLIDVDGVHHLFFQHNPYSAEDGPDSGDISWGHATSSDFVTWTQHPSALVPGDVAGYDREGCWSGCTIRLDDGRIAAMYSGNTGTRQLPCLAYADDDSLLTWTKIAANPVIVSPAPIPGLTDFRDHSIQRRGALWHQWIAVGGERGGMIVEYTSVDLVDWDYVGVFLSAREWGLPDGVWECPDVFELDGTTVVILSWYTDTDRDTIWITGRRNGEQFTPQQWGRLDAGNLAYAPQSYTADDGRRIMLAWLATGVDPASAGQVNLGAQSIPRVLGIHDGALTQAPAEEIIALVNASIATATVEDSAAISGDGSETLLITLTGDDLAQTAELSLLDAEGTRLDLPIALLNHPAHATRSGDTWTEQTRQVNSLRILFDRGLAEIFTDDGRAITTSNLALTTVDTVHVRHTRPGYGAIKVKAEALRTRNQDNLVAESSVQAR